tara:strand:+ start:325 stop:573 length:249 start_codon:yes stop_codon:yes gene_type:complete
MESKPKFKNFELPPKILTQLYELTGGAESYKGFIIAYCNEDGTPVVYTNCESQITESGLIKSIENYITEYTQNSYELSQESE